VSTVAIEGTRVLWAPGAEDQARAPVRTAGRDLLKALTQAPQGFQTALAVGFWSDAATWHASTFPRGGLFYGEVHETIEGPDGKYVCLGVQNAKVVVALRADLLTEAAGKAAASKEWAAGTQVALLGTAMGRFKMPSGEEGIYVLPFDWVATPGFAVTMPDDRRGPPPGPPDRGDRQRPPGPPGPPQDKGGGR